MARWTARAAIVLIALATNCNAKRVRDEEEGGSARLRAEVSSGGEATTTLSPEMAMEEAKAKAGLATEMSDALTDM